MTHRRPEPHEHPGKPGTPDHADRPAPTAPGQPSRRHWLRTQAGRAAGLGLVGAWPAWLPDARAAEPVRWRVDVDAAAAGTAVNRSVLGSNVQWTDGGDGLLDAQGNFRTPMTDMVARLAPTSLRFPGGLQSDTYLWDRAMGPLASRGTNEHAHSRVLQPSLMGTQEFLELCEGVGALPWITVNVMTGSEDLAARWVKQVNVDRLVSRRTGRPLPVVPTWEIGNEPYLQPDERPDLRITPTEFARRANRFIRAMRAVDPRIRIALPFTLDVRNGFPVTPYPGWTRKVLAAVDQPFDVAAVHHAYMPFGQDLPTNRNALYWGAVASPSVVMNDLGTLRDLIETLRPGERYPIALTEFHSIFTLGNDTNDALISSPTAALYVGDLLRLLATAPGLEVAHQWSLSGNWFFGTVHPQAYARPAYEAMRLMSETLRGRALPARRDSETAYTPKIGLVPANRAMPLVETLVTRSGSTLRAWFINKHLFRPAVGTLALANANVTSARAVQLISSDPMRSDDQPNAMRRRAFDVPMAATMELTLPPASMALVTFTLS